MPELTDPELIATRLLGWTLRPEDNADGKCYEHVSGAIQFVGGELDGTGCGAIGAEDWPDLTNWNDIRRMEDALAEKGLMERYIYALLRVPYCDRKTTPENMTLIMVDYLHLKQATQAQCVAAAVKVLREVQG